MEFVKDWKIKQKFKRIGHDISSLGGRSNTGINLYPQQAHEYFFNNITDIDMHDSKGMTMLMYFTKKIDSVGVNSTNLNTLRLVKFLLEYGADPNIRDINGDTALHYAATSKIVFSFDRKTLVDKIKILKENGADDTIINNIGFTPEEYVFNHGGNMDENIAKIIKEPVITANVPVQVVATEEDYDPNLVEVTPIPTNKWNTKGVSVRRLGGRKSNKKRNKKIKTNKKRKQ